MPTYEILSEGVKYVATGLLGVLWWDVRKVRQMKDTILKDVEKKYLTKELHQNQCDKVKAQGETEIIKALNQMRKDIVDEIKKTNGG